MKDVWAPVPAGFTSVRETGCGVVLGSDCPHGSGEGWMNLDRVEYTFSLRGFTEASPEALVSRSHALGNRPVRPE